MFFSFSLCTYYTFSSLIRNGHQFLGFGRAHYILQDGHFGVRPPFKDQERKPSFGEIPVQDASSLLRLTSERTIFLDEIHKNFLDLTLTEQQEIYVDFLLKKLENCLHRGLSSHINIDDDHRFQSLDNTNDPCNAFLFEGKFGNLLLSPGENSCSSGTTQELTSTITSPRLTTPSGPSNAVASPESVLATHNGNFISRRPVSRNFSIRTPVADTTYPLVNAAYHQSLPDTVAGPARYSLRAASAPANYRVVVQRKTLSTTISFCRRMGQYISYRSIPVTLRVTNISSATARNCVSLIICKVNHHVSTRRGLAQQSLTVSESFNKGQTVGFNFNINRSNFSLLPTSRDNIYPLDNGTCHHSLPATVCTVAQPINNPHSAPSAPSRYRFVVQRKTLCNMVSFCRRKGQHVPFRSLPVSIRITKISFAAKRKCVSLIICKVNHPITDKSSLDSELKRKNFQHALTIKRYASNLTSCSGAVGETVLPLPSTDMTPNIPTKISCQRLDNKAQINGTQIPYHKPGATTSLHHPSLVVPINTTSASSSHKKQGITNNSNVNHLFGPVSGGRLTPTSPPTFVLPRANRTTGGKAAAAPLGIKGLAQHNQRTGVETKVDNSANLVAPTTGQSASILGTGAIGGQVKADTNVNGPFGWGKNTNWDDRGFFQSRGSIHNREGRDPFGDVMNGAVNTQFAPWNPNERTQQAAPWASLWNIPKPCSERRNSGAMGHSSSRKLDSHQLLNDQTFNQTAAESSIWDINNFGWGTVQGVNHVSSHRLLNNRTSNQTVTPSTCTNNNNFGWGTAKGRNHGSFYRLLKSRPSNQAAKPSTTRNNFQWGATNQAAADVWSTFWGPSFLIPKASSKATKRQSSKAIPKASSKGSSVHIKFNLPTSCPEISWSDLEDVIDSRIKKPKILGSGCFGIVKLMKQLSSGKLCAVKINKDDVEETTVIKNLQLEVDVLTRLKHLDCVPELFGITRPGNNCQVPVMVLEFIGDPKTFRSMTLAIAIRAKVLPPLKAKRVALTVCEALRDIHSARLLHCDLKIDNIMLEPGFVRKDNPKVKIIDFGKAVKMDDKPKYQYNARDQMAWILKCCFHLAPEVVRGEKPYNVSSEVYGLGVILKELSLRCRGFLWQLGEECMAADYRKRPSLKDVINKIQSHLTSIQGAANQLAAAP